MFFRKINIWKKESFYKRSARITLNFICITSSQKWLDSKNSNVEYICDEEFYNKIIKPYTSNEINLAESRYLTRINISVILESLPEELRNIILLSKDVVYGFKNYLNDDKLDKLIKD